MKNRNHATGDRCLRVLLTASFFAAAVLTARAVNLVQEFYLPMPEAQIYQANSAIVGGTGSTIASTFSILVTGDGTIIYYDQWEDGYETDLSNPTQPTTQIWGDGNDAHGIPPGFAHNPLGLTAGTVITLTNNVTLPRNPSTILWDAPDRIAANKALVITRAAWPATTGPVFAGAVSVLSTMDYGTNYISPVGQNLTNNLFKYVGMFIMAAQDNTAVTIDPNGNGVGTTNIVLNQGESYLVNGGILTGGRVTATKPIQADLIIGHVGASYAADWFTLYPASEWSGSYYTPVGSAATVSQPAYVYLYNPATNAIIINYNTKVGSGSFSVPGTNGVFQFQMPVGSGASFVSAGGQNFYALCTVAANNSADTSYNWGFTLVPQSALTTVADVGWAPGSADGTVDGSPVWVTTLANTTVYVDYHGDTNGLLTDPNGNKYDTNFTVSALQSLKIFDPSKNQTGMKVYTVDGTLITAAWGEDPDTAQAGNPYIDAGTTVLPFPVPVLKKSAVIVTDVPPTGLSIGDTVQYTVEINNDGLLPLGNTLMFDAPTTNLTYITNSTTYNGVPIPDNTTGIPFPLAAPSGYTIPVILSQGTSIFQYLVQVNASGGVSNSVNIAGTTISAQFYLPPASTNGLSVTLNFSDTNGVPVSLYSVGANVYVTMTNAVGNSSPNTVQTIDVTVVDLTHGDLQTITLTETSTNTGVFRNITGLPTSATSGLAQQDGILNVSPGDILSVSYTDPIYGDSATNTIAILIPALTKQLYLSVNGATNGVQDLNRVDPVAYGHSLMRTSADIGNTGAWPYRQLININHTNVFTTDQTNFPVMINLASNTGLKNHAQASGNDILFTASDGITVLSYEREKYTSGTGALVAWVNVPIVSHTADTVIYMYYGNSAAPDQQNVHNVWDSNYKIVYHLDDAGPTTAVDSTANGNNGTATGATFGVAGEIGSATSYTNGNTTPVNYIAAGSAPGIGSNQSFSYEMWIKVTGTYVNQASTAASSGSWFLDRTVATNALVSLMPVGTGAGQFGYQTRYDDGSGLGGPSGGMVSANWTHVVMVRDYNTAFRLYVNGIQVGTTNDTGSKALTPSPPKLGRHQSFVANTPGLNGLIDEFRVSSIARSAGWIQTEFTNQASPATFYSIGTETTNFTASVTMFTQTPSFCSAFTMPSNSLITITNYITVTNGVMPTSPAITATLQYSGTNIITLSNPSYTAANSNLVWSGVLSSNVTIPAGQAISYVITNSQSGVSFHVDYDCTNNPSKITLPATTVIQVNTFSIYDAPYPNGNLVTTPVAGSRLYVRANVSDPFGSYDITSLGLAVTGPNPAASFSTNLNDAYLVASDTCSKTYEFPWTTGPTTGGYSLAATANEGTEGVSAVATASIFTIFLDLGTPSATVFISSTTGMPTNSYPAGSQVCVSVTAMDSITNAQTVQTIMATVTSSAGDSENLPLIETSTNTGIYTACIGTSTSGPGVTNDGTLYAPVGSILTASYTDPNSSSYNSSATATIQPAPGVPGVVLNKTILSPSGGQAVTGQSVTFNLQAVNIGSTTLTNLSINDSFPSVQLSYFSASLAPNIIATGLLTWTNLGAFAPGQSTNISVTFTALATGAVTNSATANGVSITNTSSVSLLVNNPALTVTKILLSPTNTPVAVGSNVVFRITVQNVGNTVVNYLPLEDTFSAAYYQFVSATIAPNGSGAGSLIWTNLASPTALATNAIITNDITMQVVGQGNPAYNTATVDYATDVFSNAVPTASSTIGVNTTSASINGHVYNDINQSGVFTNGDIGLNGVTLQLFTDPNGDGNPADGTLVQITTTDANGYYELLNLNTGHYVVVETDLPGYASSTPANNRLSINVTNLAAFTNANFFQYIPAPAVYSTISGTVWYDTNGNGTNDVGETGLANFEIDLVQDVNSNGVADSGEPVTASVTTAANGNYSFAGITPGHYVIRQTLPYGYYTTGDSQGRTDNQISFVSTNGIVSTNNSFFDRLLPIAVNDTNSALYFVPVTIYPLTNDINPNNDTLTISSATSSNGIVVINPGFTNITFTPTNIGTAIIAYTISDNHGGTSSAIISVNVTALADVAIGKTGSASVFAASNLVYTISVTNFGPTPANFVVVTDTLPAGATFVSASGNGANNSGVVSWSLGTLANGQVSNVTVTVTAPASGSLTNVASVSSPTGDPNSTNNVTPPVITTVTAVADVGLGKTAAASVPATSNLVYTMSVTNFGPSSASSVVVTDTLPANVTFVSASGGGLNNSGVVSWSLGTLANGQVSNVTVTVTAPASGSLTNVASVSSPTVDPNSTNNVTPPVITTVTAVADVGIGKSASASVSASSNLVYTISVTNFGPSSASSVVVTDTLPAGVSFVSATGGGVNNSGVVNWTLGILTSGQVSNVTVTVTAPASGSLTNVASVSSPTIDPSSTNNTTPPVITTVTPVADIGIGKSASASVSASSNLVYTISVTNFGPSSASSVTVTDTLPANVTFVSASGGGANNSGVVSWSLGTLANGQVSNVTVTVTAPASGSLTNTASVSSPTGDPNSTNNVTPPVITTVTAVADVGIGKSASASVFASSNLVYMISVTNFGPSSASSVTVTDTLPAGVSFVSATGGGVNNSGVVSWSLGTLTSGQVSNVTVTVSAPASGSLTNVAIVSSPTVDPNSTNNVTPPVITTVTAVADIGIGKSALASVSASSNLVYTISVTNFGPSPANFVVVTDTLPAGVTFVSASGNGANNSGVVNWTLGTLANGQVSNVTVTVTAPASGSLTNVASVSSPTGDPNSTNNITPPVITAVTAVADIGIGKSASASVSASSNLVYTISVTNFGPSSASSVTVTDTLPANVTFVIASGGGANNSGVVSWSLGTLANGQVSNVTVTVTAPASGSLTNVASVSSPTGDPNSTNNVTPPVITTVTAVADIGIGKSASAVVGASSNLVYTISVTNFGPSSASSVVVTDTLPAGVSFVSATGGGVNNSGVVSWSLGTLANGQVSNVTVTVTAPASGSLTNVASVSSPTGDPNSTNNVTPPVITTVTAVADIGIGKSASASVSAASNLVYTISVTNFGPSSASSVVVTDTLPANVTFVSASGNGINNSGVVSWTLGTLANGQVSNMTVTVTAPASGSLTNVATVSSPTGDPNSTNNITPPVITTVTAVANIGIGKSASASVSASSNLVYTISVTNFGPSSASSVVVTDTLPATVTFVSASGNGINNSGVVNWTLGTLANGQVSNVTVTVTAPASGSLTNVATVSSPTVDPNSTNNVTPPVVTTVTAVADVGIGKSASASVSASSNLVYTISVTNFGPSSASSVVVTDTLPASVTFVSASGGGANNSGVVSWSLGTLTSGRVSNLTVTVTAPASGLLTNVASVSSPTVDPNSTNNVTPPVITTVTNSALPQADIAVFKTGPTSGIAGSNLTYTVTVTNSGPSTATNVVVSDLLPAGFTFVSATPSSTVSNNLVSWPAISLAKNAVSNFTVTAVSAAGGNFTNIAFATSGTLDPNPTNNNGTLTNAQVRTTVAPLADVAVFKTGSTNVNAGGVVVYTITATNMGPSTASNVVVRDNLPTGVTFQSASGSYTLSNNVVTWPGVTLAKGMSVDFTLTLTAPASGSFVNVASGTSDTPDPNMTNNNGSAAGSRVSTLVTPVADLIVLLSGSTNVIVGNSLVYTIVVTNGGPSTASNIVVQDNLPAGLAFSSTSAGGSFSNNVITWPTIHALTNGGSTNFTITVTAPNVGVFTNIASALSSTLDLNLTNNNGTSPASQVQTAVMPAQFMFGISGAPVFNPQTGLFEEQVTVTNIGSTTVAGVRLLIGGLPSGVTLYDATGTNNGTPYVQYNFPLNPGNTVSFALEFYDPSRLPFTNTLTAIAILPANSGSPGTNGVFISGIFLDTRIAGDPRIVIEFLTTPGNTYTIIYSDNNLFAWQVATPSITANATTTQWYDDGPPKTDSKPFSITNRFYRVIAAP